MSHPTPALSALLSHNFSKEGAKILTEFYQISSALSEHREGRVKRAEGMSFNPLPCRIASILINEAKIRDAAVISAAFFIASNIDYFLENADFSISKIREIGKAVVIDNLRHLHMTDYSNDERAQRLAWLEGSILPKISSPSLLTPYLETAFVNARKR